MAWDWYAVKTLYRAEATGEPDFTDAGFDEQITLIEERVVLFKARSSDEAIRKAEKEAHSYANNWKLVNVYGQQVTGRYLGSCDAYCLYDPPANGIEVFSATELWRGNVADETLVDRKLGKKETTTTSRKRYNFLQKEFHERYREERSRKTQKQLKPGKA